MKPIIIINLKTYKQGKDVLKLVKEIEKVDKKIIIGAQPQDIYFLSKETKLPIYSQHVDFHKPGRNTGFITPEGIKAVGATGIFLNHSEHRLDLKTIEETTKRCKKLKLKVGIFAKDLNQAKLLKKLKPGYLIIEPPELVSKKSISKTKPELISSVSKSLKYPFIVGAGIKDSNDLKIAIKLGASGIALSSAITTSKNPKKVLKELIK